MTSILKKVRWGLFGFLSLAIGIYPVVYFLVPDRRFGLLASKTAELLANEWWNLGFYAHIIFGGIALFIGWLQFSKKLRENKPALHRVIGKTYVISVLISGVCGLSVGFFASGGIVSASGFISLGIVWLFTTINAFIAIKNGDISTHQKMMIYSYAACFGAVTLRLWLPILTIIMGEFIPAYRIVAWLCWVPNVIIAYFIANRTESSNRPISTTV